MLLKAQCHKHDLFYKRHLQLGLKAILVINKVDKPNCRPDEVHDEVFDLFFNLDATEEQLNFKTIYGSI
jgi:GTP-binding protein